MLTLVKSSFLLLGLAWTGLSLGSDFEKYSKFRNDRFELTFHAVGEGQGSATLAFDGNVQKLRYEFNEERDISFKLALGSRLPVEFSVLWSLKDDNSTLASGDGRVQLEGVFGKIGFKSQDGFFRLEFGYVDSNGKGQVHLFRGDSGQYYEFHQKDGVITIPGVRISEIAQPLILSDNGTLLTSFDDRIELHRTENTTRQIAPIRNTNSFICGHSGGVHGIITNVRSISRAPNCNYPWYRYTYEDGFVCDYRHPCH